MKLKIIGVFFLVMGFQWTYAQQNIPTTVNNTPGTNGGH